MMYNQPPDLRPNLSTREGEGDRGADLNGAKCMSYREVSGNKEALVAFIV